MSSKSSSSSSDLRFSHVDIIVDDIHAFIDKWCSSRCCLGFVASKILSWGSPNDETTWSEYAFIFDSYNGNLMFMVVQGHYGTHKQILQDYGHGTIYRLCFKTNDMEKTFYHLNNSSTTKITNIDGTVEYTSYDDVISSGKRILWLEKEGNLSMEIVTASIIDNYCDKLKQEIGLLPTNSNNENNNNDISDDKQKQHYDYDATTITTKRKAFVKKIGISCIALGTTFVVGYFLGRSDSNSSNTKN